MSTNRSPEAYDNIPEGSWESIRSSMLQISNRMDHIESLLEQFRADFESYKAAHP